MQEVLTALIKALKCLFHPRMMSLILWPMLLATLIWGGIAYYFWQDWVNSLTHLAGIADARTYLQQHDLAWIAHYLIFALIILLLIPVTYITALVVTSIFAMPIMVNHVAKRDFPTLEMKHGGTVAGSVRNGIVAIVAYAVLWLLTLPLWLFMPFALVVPIALTAYLNQRLFRYDALAEHASPEEFQLLLERSSGKFYLLGALLALIQLVPILHFFTPIYIGLAFIYLGLAELEKVRGNRNTNP